MSLYQSVHSSKINVIGVPITWFACVLWEHFEKCFLGLQNSCVDSLVLSQIRYSFSQHTALFWCCLIVVWTQCSPGLRPIYWSEPNVQYIMGCQWGFVDMWTHFTTHVVLSNTAWGQNWNAAKACCLLQICDSVTQSKMLNEWFEVLMHIDYLWWNNRYSSGCLHMCSMPIFVQSYNKKNILGF